MQIDLTLESAAVLLRCLDYGEHAISRREHKNGEGKIITNNIATLRSRVSQSIAKEIIANSNK